MRARGLPRLAELSYLISRLYLIPNFNNVASIMAVHCHQPIALYGDNVSVAANTVVTIHNFPGMRRVNGRPFRRADIEALMKIRPALTEL